MTTRITLLFLASALSVIGACGRDSDTASNEPSGAPAQTQEPAQPQQPALQEPTPQEPEPQESAQVARTQLGLIEQCLKTYCLDMNAYPTSEQGLTVLINAPPGEGSDKWNGPYLNSEEIPTDPWGNSYQYQSSADDRFRLWSFGPDGASDTDDDILSDEPEETASAAVEQPADSSSQQTPDAQRTVEEQANSTEQVAAAPRTGFPNLVPIDLELPAPAFRGTPVPIDEPNVEKPLGKPRVAFLAPEGTTNLARGKTVACSDPMPSAGEVDLVTDGDKEASDFGYLELRPGSQWVQVDLGERATIYAVLVWHSHAEARVYRDVIVLVSDDPDFLEAQTVFNNDYDNSSGIGIGTHMGYVETSEGRLVDSKGVEGRYVRLFSKGSHIDEKNHYTEVEVWGVGL